MARDVHWKGDFDVRLRSVDVLRGSAIFSMILIHFPENLSPRMEYSIFYDAFHLISELIAAPFFTILSGLSFAFALAQLASRGISDRDILNQSLKRAAALIALGFLFAFAVWGPSKIFDWDILPLLGFSCAIIALLRHWRGKYLLLLSAAIFLFTPFLREHVGFLYAWNPEVDEYIAPWSPVEILKGFLVNGFFPVFPWISFSLAGFGLGKWLQEKEITTRRLSLIGGVGIFFLASGAALALLAQSFVVGGWLSLLVTPWTIGYSKYPTLPSYILMASGLFCIAFSALFVWLDRGISKNIPVAPVLELFSKHSLTVYVAHHLLHVWPLALVGWILQDNRDAFYADVISFYPALGLGFLCFLLFIPVLKAWSSRGGRWSLEWILAKVVGKV